MKSRFHRIFLTVAAPMVAVLMSSAHANVIESIASVDFNDLADGTVTEQELSAATTGASWTLNALGQHNDAVYSITGAEGDRGFLLDSVVGVGGANEFARMTFDQSFDLSSLEIGQVLRFSLKTAASPLAPSGGGRANSYRLFDTNGDLAVEFLWVSNGNYQINDGDGNLAVGGAPITAWASAHLAEWDSSAPQVQSLLVEINSDGTYQITWSDANVTHVTPTRSLGGNGEIGSFGAYSAFSQSTRRAYHLDDIELAVALEAGVSMPFERRFGLLGAAEILNELTAPQGSYNIEVVGVGDDVFGDAIESIEDASGNERDGVVTPIGLAAFSDNVPEVVSGSSASVDLTENADIAVPGYKGISGANPRTVAAWIYPTSTAGNTHIAEWGAGGTGNRWTVRIIDSLLRVEVNQGFIVGQTELELNTWHHIAVTFEGSVLGDAKMFVNGVEEEPGISATAITTGDLYDVGIGYSPAFGGRHFNGFLDEVGIWSRALSDQEVADLAAGSLVSDFSDDLELYYDFEGDPGPLPFEGTLITSLPAELSGSLGLLPTSALPESASAGFVVNRDTTVSVAIDAERNVPAWLANHYTLSALTVGTTAGPFDVWQKDVQAREFLALPPGHLSLAFLGFGPVEEDLSSPEFAQGSLDPDAWSDEDYHLTLTTGAEFDVHEAVMFGQVINFDASRGFELATTIRVPRLQDAGDNAFGLTLLGGSEAGIRAEWLPLMAGGGSELRLVNAANDDILESVSWTGATPNSIDNNVGVSAGADETVFAVGANPFAGGEEGLFLLSEDFDGDVSGWSSESLNATPDQWEIGAPTSGPGNAFVGDNVAATRLNTGYDAESQSVLRSPEIDLSTVTSPVLTFREYMDVDTFADGGQLFHFGTVSVRDVDTQAVQELARYSQNIIQWTERELDLSAFAGSRIVIEFYFESDDIMSNAGDGWYLDDIRVSADAPTIESMPELLTLDGSLNGVATDPDGAGDESADYLQFTVEDRSASGNDGVSVFVAWDVRASGMEPDWLRGEFAQTDHFVGLTGTRHRLWVREYADGAQVTLGGASANGTGSLPEGTNNYIVLFGDARSGNETFYALAAEGTHEEGSWNLTFSLSDGDQTQTVSGMVDESLAAGLRFGVFARHPDADGGAVTHPPVWEIFNLSMDFLIGAEGFQDWREQHFSAAELADPEISGPDASPAGDGVKNLIKYALNIPPFTPVARDDLFNFSVNEAGELILVYRERTDIDDIEYIPEVSEDLIEWNSGEPHVIKVLLGSDGNYEEIEAQGSVSPEAQNGFIRLNVRQIQ